VSRPDLRLAVVIIATLGLGLAIACDDKPAAACVADVDCGPGSFCRSGLCAAVDSDGGAPDAQPPTLCIQPGGSCSIDDECCTRPCTNFRCGGGSSGTSGRTPGSSGTSGTSGTGTSSGTTSSGGSCSDFYGLCASDFDCCTGLTCNAGSCR